MTRATLLHVLERPTALGPAEVRELEQLAQAFPYCQTAHLLLAKAAHDQGTMLAGQRLRRAATYAADRALLRRLIEQEQEAEVAPEPIAPPAAPHPLDLVDWPDEYVPPVAAPLAAPPLPAAVVPPAPVEAPQPPAAPAPVAETPPAVAETAAPAAVVAPLPVAPPSPALVTPELPPIAVARPELAELVEPAAAAPVAEPAAAPTAALVADISTITPVAEPFATGVHSASAAPEDIIPASETASVAVAAVAPSETSAPLVAAVPTPVEPAPPLVDLLPAALIVPEDAAVAPVAIIIPATPVIEQPEADRPAQAPAIRPPAEVGEARFEFGLADPAPAPAVPVYELPGLVDEWASAAVTLSLAGPGLLAPPTAPALPAPAFTPAAFTGDAIVGYCLAESSRLGLSMQLLDLLAARAEAAETVTAVVAAAQPPAGPLPPTGTFFEPDPLLLDHWATHRPAAPEAPSTLDLINNFLKRQPRLTRPAMLPPTTGGQTDLSVRSTRPEPDLVSENLARIFVRQGKTARAIEIYEKLMVKQPEKMAYFAAQIQSLQPSA